MTLTRKVAYNTLIQAIGKILYLGCSLAIVMLITRHLGVAGYGNYNTIIAYLGFFSVLADLGLWMIMVREISQHPRQKEKIVGNVLGLRIFTAIIALVLANGVAFFLDYPSVVKIGILIFSGGIFFMLLNQVLLGIFQYNLRADKASVAEVSGRALTLVLVIYLIHRGAGLIPIVAVSAAGFALNFFMSYIFASQYIKIIPKLNFPFWKHLLRATISLAIMGILGTIYFKIDTVLLSLLPLKKVVIEQISHFSNAEAVGIYGIAYRVLDIVITFPYLFASLVYPLISENISSDFKKTQRFFQRAFDFLLITGILFSLLGFYFAPEIIEVLGGGEFTQSIVILKILALPFFSHFIGNLPGYVLTAAHKQKVLVLPLFIFMISNIVANVIFVPYYSFYASAVITAIGEIVVCVVSFYLAIKHTKLVPSLRILPRTLSAGGVTVGSLILISKYNLINFERFFTFPLWEKIILLGIMLGLTGVYYFFFLYIFKGIKKEDIKEIIIKR